MISVTLSYPNRQTREVLLAGVPRKGDAIRLTNGVGDPELLVIGVLWMQGSASAPEPFVVVSVRERDAF